MLTLGGGGGYGATFIRGSGPEVPGPAFALDKTLWALFGWRADAVFRTVVRRCS